MIFGIKSLICWKHYDLNVAEHLQAFRVSIMSSPYVKTNKNCGLIIDVINGYIVIHIVTLLTSKLDWKVNVIIFLNAAEFFQLIFFSQLCLPYDKNL